MRLILLNIDTRSHQMAVLFKHWQIMQIQTGQLPQSDQSLHNLLLNFQHSDTRSVFLWLPDLNQELDVFFHKCRRSMVDESLNGDVLQLTSGGSTQKSSRLLAALCHLNDQTCVGDILRWNDKVITDYPSSCMVLVRGMRLGTNFSSSVLLVI